MVFHVIPIEDIREHKESTDCWCKPNIEDEIVVHNSMDGREKYETGERKLS